MRRKSIDAMEEACLKGIEEDGGQKFKEFIDLYMNSKYARTEYLPTDTNNGEVSNIQLILLYLEKTKTDFGGEINNLKHLRGATTKLMNESIMYKDNFSISILNAISVLAIEAPLQNEVSIKNSKKIFQDAFLEMTKIDNLFADDALKIFNDILKQCGLIDPLIFKNLYELKAPIFLKINLMWVSNFYETKLK